MDHEREIVSLNIRNLDIQALERRLELAAGLVASLDGWACAVDCPSNCATVCAALCSTVCEGHCGSFCPAVCSIDQCGVNCGVVTCNTNYCDHNS